jgi:hypothetical protein
MDRPTVYSLQNEAHLEEIRRMLEEEDEGDISDSLGLILEETDTDEDVPEQDNAVEDVPGRNDESEPEITDESEPECMSDDENFYVAHQMKNKKIIDTWKWKKHPFNQSRKRGSQNVLVELPGVKGAARNINSVLGAWSLLFDDTILNTIVECTNKYIDRIAGNFSRPRDAKHTDFAEIKAFIGILYLTGVYKANHLNLEELWSSRGDGVEIFRLTMGLRRFRFLLRCLRFDDHATRTERRATDRLAAIRECFERYVSNCQKYYSPGQNTTIDEMLVSFRGKCVFRQFNIKKPAKYGIKIFSLTDARIPYSYNLEIYVGTQPEGPFVLSNKPVDVVKRLVHPIKGSGRNITFDNWFCNYNLVSDLKAMKLSMVGTLRSNKPQIPLAFKRKRKEEKSSIFGFQKDATLVSYVPKQNKNVFLLSSLHFDGKIDDETGNQKKPEIITFYNHTKCGVDVVDQMCAAYNVSRATKRWPMVIFFSMLNTAGINSQILFTSNKNKVKSRRDFLRQLAVSLMQDNLNRRRTSNTGLPVHISGGLKRRFCDSAVPTNSTQSQPQEQRRLDCLPCKEEKRRRLTQYKCHLCGKPLCLQHSRMRCQNDCSVVSDSESVEED